MSAVEPQKTAEVPVAAAADPAPAVVEPVPIDIPVVGDASKPEETKAEDEVVAPVEEKKEEKVEAKIAEPIYSGALGYKAPGLKNAFRFAKKYFWFGEEAVPAANLREYLRGEKPEVAHSVAAWSSQTGKGLLYFVKHADQKEHPAGALNLAYATDLHKDGTQVFAFKVSGSKHSFEAQNALERDGWYLAVEKAITEAKASKDTIESSEAYKEEKEKISKPVALVAPTASAPKKSTDATPKAADTEAVAGEEPVVAPARTGSSSSSSDEEKKAKKSKSRSVSRKRASIFGGLIGKKDKAEAKKDEHKEGESSKAVPEVKDDAAPVAETAAAPVITEPTETEASTAPVIAPVDEVKTDDAAAVKPIDEKPKPTKRASIFGSFFEKVKSPTHEKKEADIVPAPVAKDGEAAEEAAKPLEEAQVAVPTTIEPVSEPATVKADEVKPVSTPSKEKEHFKFGSLFGSKDRAKSPAATDKTPLAEPSKVDAVAPKIEDPAATEQAEPVVVAPVVDSTKVEPTAETKKEKRSSIFGSLGRSLSKAAKGGKETKKEATTPTTVPEASEPKEDVAAAPVSENSAAVAAPAEQTIGDVVPGAVSVGEAPKSTSTVPTTA